MERKNDKTQKTRVITPRLKEKKKKAKRNKIKHEEMNIAEFFVMKNSERTQNKRGKQHTRAHTHVHAHTNTNPYK